MKRVGVTRLGNPDDLGQGPTTIQQQPGAPTMHNLNQPNQPIIGTTALLSVGSAVSAQFVRAAPRAPLQQPQNVGVATASAPAVINYLKAGGTVQPYKATMPQSAPLIAHRHKPNHYQLPTTTSATKTITMPVLLQSAQAPPSVTPTPPPPPPSTAQFQRLKVEDALSYLDQVKYKFSSQPQVYNDFLDIMKEFKSQSIDTPGVIARVSTLFKDHPELIVGFNTFLPPGYKIEVQANKQGIACTVSISMPSPTGMGGSATSGGNVMISTQQQSPLLHMLLPGGGIAHNLTSSALATNLTSGSGAGGVAGSLPSVSVSVGGGGGGGNTLHHISQAHQQLEAAGHAPPQQGQPVEFNHAIEYVNKIKSRFSRQPDKYKRFLEILHAYQRGHRDAKEPQVKQQTEQEVYSQVAKLFENQDDLLAEFGQFLPDASAPRVPPPQRLSVDSPVAATGTPHQQQQQQSETTSPAVVQIAQPTPPQPPTHAGPQSGGVNVVMETHQHNLHQPLQPKHAPTTPSALPAPLKRSPSFTSHNNQIGITAGPPAAKKPRPSALTGPGVRDVSYAEAAKYGTLSDYSFFDRVRKALRSQEVYDNFLRCLLLFTNEVISKSELSQVVAPFLSRHPDLQRWLNDFLGLHEEAPAAVAPTPNAGLNNTSQQSVSAVETTYSRSEPLGSLGAQIRNDRPQGDITIDVDLSTCKRLGTSYCALPRGSDSRRCSGRNALCRDVLNDTWVSFPTWSEDSTFVTSRKTQYEEYIYRCEDERFELDVVIETNASTIRVLEGVQKKLSRMSADEAARYRLDDTLGGHSTTIHRRALRRIYGEKANDIIAGLKKNPLVAVPVVLRRLKAKEEEWREAQKGFNKQWREQNEKYYLKSLDHQGLSFKQNDLKALRSKSLYNEIEAAYTQRRRPPHLTVDVQMGDSGVSIMRDAAELLIHHARRQTAIQKAEKRRIKQLLRQFVPDLFHHPRQPLSDDDEEKEDHAGVNAEGDRDSDSPDTNNESQIKIEKAENSSESDTNASEGKCGRNKEHLAINKISNNNNLNNKDTASQQDANSGGTAKSKDVNCGKAEPMQCDGVGPPSERSNVKVEPETGAAVKTEASSDDKGDPSESVFVCTSSWYLFLRLHAVLCTRLAGAQRRAREIAQQEALDKAKRDPPVAMALRLRPGGASAERVYPALLDLVRAALDGNVDPAAYEDGARSLLGIYAYPSFTLDKLVSYAVRQLQHCVSEAWSVRAAELATRGGMRSSGAARASYIRKATRHLRTEHAAFLVHVYGGEESRNVRVTFELLEGADSPQRTAGSPSHQLDNGSNGNTTVSRLAEWSRYTERYANPANRVNLNKNCIKPLFLRRNVRACGGVVDDADRLSSSSEQQQPSRVADPVNGGGATATVARARRKPPLVCGGTEDAGLAPKLRIVSGGGGVRQYRTGALSRAKSTHARLHASRSRRMREIFHLT